MHENRKKFSFIVSADLTKFRYNLLKFAKEQCSSDAGEPNFVAAHRVVDFVFCDQNCKIKLKTKQNKFYTVSSRNELLNLVNRLDNEMTYSATFKNDECNREKYGRFEEEVDVNEMYK